MKAKEGPSKLNASGAVRKRLVWVARFCFGSGLRKATRTKCASFFRWCSFIRSQVKDIKLEGGKWGASDFRRPWIADGAHDEGSEPGRCSCEQSGTSGAFLASLV
jgi:hypothetical protein